MFYNKSSMDITILQIPNWDTDSWSCHLATWWICLQCSPPPPKANKQKFYFNVVLIVASCSVFKRTLFYVLLACAECLFYCALLLISVRGRASYLLKEISGCRLESVWFVLCDVVFHLFRAALCKCYCAHLLEQQHCSDLELKPELTHSWELQCHNWYLKSIWLIRAMKILHFWTQKMSLNCRKLKITLNYYRKIRNCLPDLSDIWVMLQFV